LNPNEVFPDNIRGILHNTHRIGINADVSGGGPGGSFMLPDTMKNVVYRVGWNLGLYIDYNYENGRNHYHFYVFRIFRR